MKKNEIVTLRLRHQLVIGLGLADPHQVVQHMGAIQAQDYRSSLWAIGLRVGDEGACNEAIVEQAVLDKQIVRTWPMRGTLHWVTAADARWMLHLLAPRVVKSTRGRYRQLELDERVFDKSREILESNMAGGRSLTRTEIYQLLTEGGIATHDQRGIHIIGYWAMKALICQAPKKNRQDAFVLLDEWLPGLPELMGVEALAALAERYIRSHGPATEYDFASWAGVTISDARRALEMLLPQLQQAKVEGDTYWFAETEGPLAPLKEGTVFLLPAFDEMLCGYKDRTALLTSAEMKATILKNGIFKPIVLLDNRAVGTWQRTVKADQVVVSFSFFRPLSPQEIRLIGEKARLFKFFFEKEVVVVS